MRKTGYFGLALVIAALSTGAQDAAAPDVILLAANATLNGAWRVVTDSTAAGGRATVLPNTGRAKVVTPLANPVDYFELSFTVTANTPYRLWVRGRADGNSGINDSVHVQFTNSINASGQPAWRIGTTSSAEVNLEDCVGCGNSGWGWEDNGWGSPTTLGPEIIFATSGTQRLRVQNREDGFFIDQIVLSPSTYLTKPPGANKNDSTYLVGAPTTLVRQPYLMQLGDRSVVIVWASHESGAGSVRIAGRIVAATTTRYAASTTGMTTDYYQHEAHVSGLTASTSYSYEARVGGVRVATGTVRTAPTTGTGSVRFIAFGDSGTGSTNQRALASVMAADSWDFAVHVGDMVYGLSNGTGDATYKTYHSWFFDIYRNWLPNRGFFPSTGNHDSRPSNGNGKAYLNLFVLPEDGGASAFPDNAERYYSFDYGPVHFIVLDTETAFQDLARRQVQLQWAEADLSSTPQLWKVAVFHRSPFSTGAEHGSDLTVRNAFAPIFERHGVQLALSGHDHDYERSVPWRLSTDRTQQGVTYVVTGAGGAPLYSVGTSTWTVRTAKAYAYTRVNVSGCTMFLEGVGLNGTAFDRFTLDRCKQASDAGPPTARITSSFPSPVSGNVTVAIGATDDTRVEKVNLYVDGKFVGYDRSASYAVVWNSRTVAAGTHTLQARAYDLAGNVTASAKVTVTSTGS